MAPPAQSGRNGHPSPARRAAAGGEVAAGEVGDDFAGTEVLKEQRLPGTVCRRSGGGVRLVMAFIHSLSDALPASPFNLV